MLHALILLFVIQPLPVIGPLVALAGWAATRARPRARRALQLTAALVAVLALVAWSTDISFADPIADLVAWGVVAMVPWFAVWHLLALANKTVHLAVGVVSVLVLVVQGFAIPGMLVGGWPDAATPAPMAEVELADDRTASLFPRAHATSAGWGSVVVTAAVDPWSVLERRLAGRTLPLDFDRGSLQVVESGTTVRLEWQTADGPAHLELSP